MSAGNQFDVIEMVQEIDSDLLFHEHVITRFLSSTLVQVEKKFSSGQHLFSMERYLVLNSINGNIVFASNWQLVLLKSKLALGARYWNFNHLMNKHHSDALSSAKTALNALECIGIQTTSPLPDLTTILNIKISAEASSAIIKILTDLNKVIYQITPTSPNSCNIEVQLCLEDHSYLAIIQSFTLNQFNQLVRVGLPCPLKTYTRNRSQANRCQIGRLPNSIYPDQVVSDVFQWIILNQPELILLITTDNPIPYSELGNICSRHYT